MQDEHRVEAALYDRGALSLVRIAMPAAMTPSAVITSAAVWATPVCPDSSPYPTTGAKIAETIPRSIVVDMTRAFHAHDQSSRFLVDLFGNDVSLDNATAQRICVGHLP
jgi:hypothetical protein